MSGQAGGQRRGKNLEREACLVFVHSVPPLSLSPTRSLLLSLPPLQTRTHAHTHTCPANPHRFLGADEMMSALHELGMLEGMRPRQLGKFLSTAIREADSDKDGLVSLDDFTKYYERLAR